VIESSRMGLVSWAWPVFLSFWMHASGAICIDILTYSNAGINCLALKILSFKIKQYAGILQYLQSLLTLLNIWPSVPLMVMISRYLVKHILILLQS